MIHMIFELLVSSARICAYTSATPGACAVVGIATSIKQHSKNAQTLATVPPKLFFLLRFALLSRTSIYAVRFFGGNPGSNMQEIKLTRSIRTDMGEKQEFHFLGFEVSC